MLRALWERDPEGLVAALVAAGVPLVVEEDEP
jgi:hypothetical protein